MIQNRWFFINFYGIFLKFCNFRRAIGVQFSSKKKTMPTISFGKANRDYKVGTFKDMMATQPTKIRIDHPKF